MKGPYRVPIFLFQLLLFAPAISRATNLKDETVKAWNEYVSAANSRMERRLDGNSPFLLVDEVPERAEHVRQGQIFVTPADGRRPHRVPHGLVHDWVGAIFIPQATIRDVLAVVNDYDRYQEIYKPAVIDSKLLGSAGSEQKFSMIMMRKVLAVTAAVDGEYQSHCVQLDPKRWYCISYSTCVREIKNFRQNGEHELPPNQGSGYVWRLHSIARFQERDGGVYAELEAIVLSRDIPFEVQWFVKPILEHLSHNSMVTTLQETRDAVRDGERPKVPVATETRQVPDAGNHANIGALATSRLGP